MKFGIYEEIINKKLASELNIDEIKFGKEKLDSEKAKNILTRYISNITKDALDYVRNIVSKEEIDDNVEYDEIAEDEKQEEMYLRKQVCLCNEIIELLKEKLDNDEYEDLKIEDDAEVLTYVYSRFDNNDEHIEKIRPNTSISNTSLFTGSRSEPSLMEELKKEILTSDEILMLVSFIKWSGLITIIDELKRFTDSGKKLKIITTSYMGATDCKAIEKLSELKNTEIKISYDIQRTRLHAKAYVFKRDTGFSTAYIGSSNMSNVAMTSGLEWNVKLSEKESFEVFSQIRVTFESYWNDRTFETFNNTEEDKRKLREALKKSTTKEKELYFDFCIKPYAYQKEILDKLEVEREVFGRYKNLVVSATGTGKTIVAAFDFKRFKEKNDGAKLLFVSHRKEILEKSMGKFRGILKDLNFGEILDGNNKPDFIDNLFINIHSFKSSKLQERTSPDFYDYIVIDEVHHDVAKSYRELLEYYKPKVLLGLTATPERMDGDDVTKYFDNRIAYEMRLPEAIDNKLLCPFQYFGVTDDVDLSGVKWTRGGYDEGELCKLYIDGINANRRVDNIIYNTQKYVNDMEKVKGLGFCVEKKHAEFMAKKFNEKGIPSIALTSDTNATDRRDAIKKLVKGDINFIFTVDLFNEGVDIPEVDTILFLRPTQSLTVFLQQLGRGLRLCDGKDCLTVLDFIGQANKKYNFEEKFRALVGKTKSSIKDYINTGFTLLPKGCYIKLEKLAEKYVLDCIKESIFTTVDLVNKIKRFEEETGLKLNLINFLDYHNIDIEKFYNGSKNGRTFTRLLEEAGLVEKKNQEVKERLAKQIPTLLKLDSPKLIDFALDYIKENKKDLNSEEKLLLNMLYYTFYVDIPKKMNYESEDEALRKIFEDEDFKNEIVGILEYLYGKIDNVPIQNDYDFECPLQVHSTYTLAQIMASYGFYNENEMKTVREGVKYLKDKNIDCFFITLNKSDKDFSETTLYEDYAINEELFHWQTQNKTSENGSVVERYINNKGRISLFVREYKKDGNITSPYMYLGECRHISHQGNKPVSFIFKLNHTIPGNFITKANKNII